MICHELKTIFIHIPKTAGVSVTHAIMSHITGRDTSGEIGHLSSELKEQFSVRNKQKHKQARKFVPEDISQNLWNEYYKFTFVRNPWDRAVSEFHWRHSLEKRKPSTDFKEFLNYCGERIQDKNNSKRDIYWTHAQTQKSYVTNHNGKLILDDTFRFEDMDNNIKIISEKLNVPINLKKHNSSRHHHYRDYYDEESKEMVSKLYKEDIEMFGYEF